MRYFFHVEGVRGYQDKNGLLFASVEEALVEARKISEDMTCDVEYHGYNVSVVDAKGNRVDVVPIPVRLH